MQTRSVKPRIDDQVLLDKFFLDKFIARVVMPAFEQGSLSRKNLSRKNLSIYVVQKNLLEKNLFIVHTSKENYVKKLVKENLVVCAGLYSRLIQLETPLHCKLQKNCLVYNSAFTLNQQKTTYTLLYLLCFPSV